MNGARKSPAATGLNHKTYVVKHTQAPAGIQELLSRLEGVKRTGDGRWMARCPAHQDRSPSLSIKECGDGTILLHDFGGCEALDVVQAIGLELRDLFPTREYQRATASAMPSWKRERLQAALDHELLVAEIARNELAQGKRLSSEDARRYFLSSARIDKLRRSLG